MLKRPYKILMILFFLLIIFISSIYYVYNKYYYNVKQVVDGDTIILEDGREIRYLGIDAPELKHNKTKEECGGGDATKYNQKLLLGHKVRLVSDKEDKDQYGRLLRYVYTDNNVFVNSTIIKEGQAQVFEVFPNMRFNNILLASQEEAKNRKKGIWTNCFPKLNTRNNVIKNNCFIPNELREHIGETTCVVYKVVSVYKSDTGLGVIYLRDKQPKDFSIAIFPSALSNFLGDPLTKYTGKKIKVNGIIRSYRGNQEMIVNDEQDIQILY